MTFHELGLIYPILKAIELANYQTPTPIQLQTIPPLLEGLDVLGSAQTGTGKTAAFAIPILQRLSQNKINGPHQRRIRVLVLTPTRELANQIGDNFTIYSKYLNLKNTVIFGGVSQRKQEDVLYRGVDILIATPGRLLDLIGQGIVSLQHVEYLVLDEADQMLDMGFIKDVQKIIGYVPIKRQTMLFSATMPKAIEVLSQTILNNPIRIAITPVTKTIDAIKQQLYYVDKKSKSALLIHLIKASRMQSVLVFTRTKHGANKVTKDLITSGIKAEAIHGNKSQSARELALSNFKKGKTTVLVATDIAARGLDITALSYVFNYDLPEVAETYIHRIGRTGRAGLSGIAISFCDILEKKYLKDIEKHIQRPIEVILDHPHLATAVSIPNVPISKPLSQVPRNKRNFKPKQKEYESRKSSAKPSYYRQKTK